MIDYFKTLEAMNNKGTHGGTIFTPETLTLAKGKEFDPDQRLIFLVR